MSQVPPPTRAVLRWIGYSFASLAQVLRPDAIAAGRENAVGIDRILQPLMEAAQGVVVERVRIHDHVLVRGSSAVFPEPVLGRDLHELLKSLAGLLVRLDVVSDRKAEEEQERPLPEEEWHRERRDRQAKFPTRSCYRALRFGD